MHLHAPVNVDKLHRERVMCRSELGRYIYTGIRCEISLPLRCTLHSLMSAVCIIAPREYFAGKFIGLSLMEALLDLQHRARIDSESPRLPRSISRQLCVGIVATFVVIPVRRSRSAFNALFRRVLLCKSQPVYRRADNYHSYFNTCPYNLRGKI